MPTSAKLPSGLTQKARVFAALGDETRLLLVVKLGSGHGHSISRLAEGTKLSRQAVTKHLRVLERVKVVHSTRQGRESLFELDTTPIRELATYLETVSKQWDSALNRLRTFVESNQE